MASTFPSLEDTSTMYRAFAHFRRRIHPERLTIMARLVLRTNPGSISARRAFADVLGQIRRQRSFHGSPGVAFRFVFERQQQQARPDKSFLGDPNTLSNPHVGAGSLSGAHAPAVGRFIPPPASIRPLPSEGSPTSSPSAARYATWADFRCRNPNEAEYTRSGENR